MDWFSFIYSISHTVSDFLFWVCFVADTFVYYFRDYRLVLKPVQKKENQKKIILMLSLGLSKIYKHSAYFLSI